MYHVNVTVEAIVSDLNKRQTLKNDVACVTSYTSYYLVTELCAEVNKERNNMCVLGYSVILAK